MYCIAVSWFTVGEKGRKEGLISKPSKLGSSLVGKGEEIACQGKGNLFERLLCKGQEDC